MIRIPASAKAALLRCAGIALLLATGCAAPPAREKTDGVVLRNGDRFTGEIKALEQGKLKLKTTALDTVYVRWNEIAEVASSYQYEVEDRSGKRSFGRLAESAPGVLTLLAEDGTSTTLALADIVRITPIGQSFWSKVDGHVGFGFSYTKASDVGQLSAGIGATYVTRERKTSADLSLLITNDSEGETTSRDDLSLFHARYWKRLFLWLNGLAERNEALGLDLRVLAAAGAGSKLLQTSQNMLELGLGLAFSEVDASDSASSSAITEGVLFANYSIFRFGARDVDSDITLAVYPGITESGRLRAELDAAIRREILKDLFLELSGYGSYDNEPPPGAEKSDFGIVTSLGWSF